MQNIFKKEYIQFINSVDSWESGIKIACEPLVKHGNVNENFAQNIIDVTNELGPYYILAKDLAMGHVTPDGSVMKNGLSLLFLNKPINFKKNNDPTGNVKFLFILSTIDNDSHLDILKNMSKAFGNKEFYKEFYDVTKYEDIEILVEKYLS